ncbi:MAG: ATP-dependent zinc metalloprotease FtsH [Chloroflexi bacterium ADurb.Bin222]|nr:MAG: ATP-dependent zinc metalloprotease FtsH [Chloroflexi bacterium ADurb.Bin222]
MLLDGLEGRNGVTVLATTNRPAAIDPALRRPGRFDRIIWLHPPDPAGRLAILRHHLAPLRLAAALDRDALLRDLAAQMEGATGADLAYLCQSAASRCVQEAVQAGVAPDQAAITHTHLLQAVSIWQADREERRPTDPRLSRHA